MDSNETENNGTGGKETGGGSAHLHGSPHAKKAGLRKQVLQRRAGLLPQAREAASERILEKLAGLPEFQNARGVHCFVSMRDEVDTEPIFKACWGAGKVTFVPVQVPERSVLESARRNPGDELAEGPFGVPEPPLHSRRAVSLREIDLVLAPGVAFDRGGNRLGYGRGYYDKFLISFGKNFVKNSRDEFARPAPAVIALAFGVQIVEEVPRDPWDVAMTTILTEQEIIRIG